MLDKKMGIRQVGTDQCFVIVEKDREPYKWEDDKKPYFLFSPLFLVRLNKKCFIFIL